MSGTFRSRSKGNAIDGIGAVDLAREPVAVEDRLGDHPRRDAVADPVDGLDARRIQRLLIADQLPVQRVVGHLLGHEDDAVGLDRPRLLELVLAGHLPRFDREDRDAAVHRDARLVQVLAEHRALERQVRDR